MPFTAEQLENFHHFAQVRLQAVPAESLEELVDLWRLEHPDAEEQADTHHAIRQGLADEEMVSEIPGTFSSFPHNGR